MSDVRYVDAIRMALRDELERDDAVMLLGEDITVGGPFGATAGLVEEFGPGRVRNTPISEATVVGMAIGAAAVGVRPVVEVMFADFITLAMDQLVNHAAKLRYMSAGQLSVPLTVRVQGGAVGGFGAHHSQSLEAWFAHVPGLKVVAPSNSADARGLLIASIRDDDPVIYLEHRGLYWTKGPVSDEVVPLGRARVARRGRDATVVSWSRMLVSALEAAEDLTREDLDVEVIDVRSLVPLDVDLIMDSVRRTRRVVIAHEAVLNSGFGAEIAASIAEMSGPELAVPIRRVGAPATPVPAGPDLERSWLPGPDRIATALREVVRGSSQSRGQLIH